MPLTARFVNCSAIWRTLQTPSKPVATDVQVANQQGRYLAKVFNMHRVGQHPDPASCNGLPAVVPPFQYRHLGSFAYVGADQAVLELAMQGGCSGLLEKLLPC